MYERTTYLNSELYNAFEFYVLFAMFYRGHMDWTLPTCVTRWRHSSCCTAIKAIAMYWCFLCLWYWYWLFVHDSWAVSALLSVNKIITYLLTFKQVPPKFTWNMSVLAVCPNPSPVRYLIPPNAQTDFWHVLHRGCWCYQRRCQVSMSC